MPGDKKITSIFVLQFCVVALTISAVVFRRGEWSGARRAELSIAIPAAVLFVAARWQLGKSFFVTPQAHSLVTHGVDSRIRNPIYVFSGLTLLGILIALQSRYGLLLLAVVIPVQVIRAHQETRVLEARFGDKYREYRQGTWF
jgi:protein-S-isoprenylcysteine O-methyltransferase Ste14